MKKHALTAERIVPWAIVLLFFLAFALISRWTPAAGDDWVYAVGGRYHNPLVRAAEMYFSWSGRFLSELYGYLVTPHKNLWNLLNPCLFTGIFCLILKLAEGKTKRHPIASALLLALLVFSVPYRLRMQTYTWMMGTTYVIPLFLFLLDMVLMKEWILEGKNHLFWCILLNFCVPLYMENAAALMVGADLLILIDLYWIRKDPQKSRQMLVLLLAAAAGACIILFSPGAHARLIGDQAAFHSLSISQKLALNFPLFLEHTYTDNRCLMAILSIVLIAVIFQSSRRIEKPKEAAVLMLICALSPILNLGGVYLLETIAMVLVMVLYETDSFRKQEELFYLLCALGADLVMLASPIFDSRSSLYTVFLLFLLAELLFESVSCSRKPVRFLIIGVLGVLSVIRGLSYYQLYHMVHSITIKRNQEIAYYQTHPDAGEAWLIAYPDESIHSPNVLQGDETHDRFFKEYYYLNQDLELKFYYLKEYTAEQIFASD
ncbi:MAG: DUF6056 family protein [Erysipelotrichaceae bacterium]|nr:DUF6056 family protein [Erysipelotrichaceae bacterium]